MGSPLNGSFRFNEPQLGRQCAGISAVILMTVVFTTVIYWFFYGLAKIVFQQDILVSTAAPAVADLPAKEAATGVPTEAKGSA